MSHARKSARPPARFAALCAGVLLGGACILAPNSARAVTPVGPLSNQIIRLDGTPLGSAIAFRSSVPTVVYDTATVAWHMWVQVADETGATGPDCAPASHQYTPPAPSATPAASSTTKPNVDFFMAVTLNRSGEH